MPIKDIKVGDILMCVSAKGWGPNRPYTYDPYIGKRYKVIEIRSIFHCDVMMSCIDGSGIHNRLTNNFNIEDFSKSSLTYLANDGTEAWL